MRSGPFYRHHEAGGQLRHMWGWNREATDLRDRKLTIEREDDTLAQAADLKESVPVRDQGQKGTCTANAGSEAAGFLYVKSGKPDPMFSRLDLYANTRELEGTPLSEDSGCQVRSVFKAMRRFGVCLETTWPYIEDKFSVHPPRTAIVEALKHQAIQYLACDNLTAIKHSIIDGYPVIGGFDCYSSMFAPDVDKTGVIPLPKPGDSVEGGHCIMFVGYDNRTRLVKFQNSWSTSWGAGGYGFLPFDYFAHGLAADFWTLRTEEM